MNPICQVVLWLSWRGGIATHAVSCRWARGRRVAKVPLRAIAETLLFPPLQHGEDPWSEEVVWPFENPVQNGYGSGVWPISLVCEGFSLSCSNVFL